MNPYDDLLALAERESELIASGAWEELTLLEDERRAVLAGLPEDPPQSALVPLERAQRILQRNSAAMASSMAQVRGELEKISRARTTLGSYASAPQPRLDFRG